MTSISQGLCRNGVFLKKVGHVRDLWRSIIAPLSLLCGDNGACDGSRGVAMQIVSLLLLTATSNVAAIAIVKVVCQVVCHDGHWHGLLG